MSVPLNKLGNLKKKKQYLNEKMAINKNKVFSPKLTLFEYFVSCTLLVKYDDD